jgi:hypothetical protein
MEVMMPAELPLDEFDAVDSFDVDSANLGTPPDEVIMEMAKKLGAELPDVFYWFHLGIPNPNKKD